MITATCGTHVDKSRCRSPIILICGVGLDVCKCERKELEIMMTCFKLQSSVNLSGHPSYRRLLTFLTIVKEVTYISTHKRARSPSSYSASARARCAPCDAQHLATLTIILNFCGENILDPKSNHEIHKNIVPRKFGAIRYMLAAANAEH